MSIYQGTISSFPELKERYKYFSQDPIVNGGYNDTTPFLAKRAIFRTRGKRVQDNNQNWVTVNNLTLWSQEVLNDGKFILYKDVIYRIMQSADWVKQGGFFVYELEERIGANTLKQFAPVAETGANQFI